MEMDFAGTADISFDDFREVSFSYNLYANTLRDFIRKELFFVFLIFKPCQIYTF